MDIAVVPTLADSTPVPGSREKGVRRLVTNPEYRAIGILYCKMTSGVPDFRVIYEGHIEPAIQDEVAARFGAGAMEWKEK